MKIKTLKKNQICILNNEFVVIVNRWFKHTHHRYEVKPLEMYHKSIRWQSYYYYKSFSYDQLVPTKFVIKDIIFTNDKTPYLTPLYLEHPELLL